MIRKKGIGLFLWLPQVPGLVTRLRGIQPLTTIKVLFSFKTQTDGAFA
jgi:hypothetical protein